MNWIVFSRRLKTTWIQHTGINRNYRGVAIVADVIADLVTLSITAYNSTMKISEVSRLSFAKHALEFAYEPIKRVLTELSGAHPNLTVAQRELGAVPNLLMSASNVVGNASNPSYWANVIANIREGRWRTAFTRDPAVEITQIQTNLKRQHVEALEAMERQISKFEVTLGLSPTGYICRAVR